MSVSSGIVGKGLFANFLPRLPGGRPRLFGVLVLGGLGGLGVRVAPRLPLMEPLDPLGLPLALGLPV